MKLPSFLLTAALVSGAAAQSGSMLQPSLFEATSELTLSAWTIHSTTTGPDGRLHREVRAQIGNTDEGRFYEARFTITAAPAGVEIADATLTREPEPHAPYPPGSYSLAAIPPLAAGVPVSTTATLITASSVDDAAFLAALNGGQYTIAAEARELTVFKPHIRVWDAQTGVPDVVTPAGLRRFNTFQYVQGVDAATITCQVGQARAQYNIKSDYLFDGLSGNADASPDAACGGALTSAGTQINPDRVVVLLDPDWYASLTVEQQGKLPPAENFPIAARVRPFGEVIEGVTRHYMEIEVDATGLTPEETNPLNIIQTTTSTVPSHTYHNDREPADTETPEQDYPEVWLGDMGYAPPRYHRIAREQMLDGVTLSGLLGWRRMDMDLILKLRRQGGAGLFHVGFRANAVMGHSLLVECDRATVDSKGGALRPPMIYALRKRNIGPFTLEPFVKWKTERSFSVDSDGPFHVGWDNEMHGTFTAQADANSATPVMTFTGDSFGGSRTPPFIRQGVRAHFEGVLTKTIELHVRLGVNSGKPPAFPPPRPNPYPRTIASIGDTDINFDLSNPFTIGQTVVGLEIDDVMRFDAGPGQAPRWRQSSSLRARGTFKVQAGLIWATIKIVDASLPLAERETHALEPTAPPDAAGRPEGADEHWAVAAPGHDWRDACTFPDESTVMVRLDGTLRAIVCRVNKDGTLRWARQLNSFPTVHRVLALPDGGVFLYADGLSRRLARLDANGDLVWAKTLTFPSGTFILREWAVAPDGTGGYSLYGAGHSGVVSRRNLLVKLDSSGAVLWSRELRGTGSEYLTGVAAMPDGGCVVCGLTDAPWADTRSIIDDSDNASLIRVAPDGTALWGRAMCSKEANDVAVHDDGRIAVTTSAIGDVRDPFRGPGLHSFDQNGTLLLQSSYNVDGVMENLTNVDDIVDGGISICPAHDGGWLIASQHGRNTTNFTLAASILHVNARGEPRWHTLMDWTTPYDVPLRIMRRGTCAMYLGQVRGGSANGGAASDFGFLTCVPDYGLLPLIEANGFASHRFVHPRIDNFGGVGLFGMFTGEPAPMSLTVVDGAAATTASLSITSTAVPQSLTYLSDSRPSAVPPPAAFGPHPQTSLFSLQWPEAGGDGTGLCVLESPDFSTWTLCPVTPQLHNGTFVVPLPVNQPRAFFKLQRTGRSD